MNFVQFWSIFRSKGKNFGATCHIFFQSVIYCCVTSSTAAARHCHTLSPLVAPHPYYRLCPRLSLPKRAEMGYKFLKVPPVAETLSREPWVCQPGKMPTTIFKSPCISLFQLKSEHVLADLYILSSHCSDTSMSNKFL